MSWVHFGHWLVNPGTMWDVPRFSGDAPDLTGNVIADCGPLNEGPGRVRLQSGRQKLQFTTKEWMFLKGVIPNCQMFQHEALTFDQL